MWFIYIDYFVEVNERWKFVLGKFDQFDLRKSSVPTKSVGIQVNISQWNLYYLCDSYDVHYCSKAMNCALYFFLAGTRSILNREKLDYAQCSLQVPPFSFIHWLSWSVDVNFYLGTFFSTCVFFYFKLESLITFFIANCKPVENQSEMYSSFFVCFF